MTVYAIDFETYYEGKYSLRHMSPQNYVKDERFDAYLVAIIGSDGYEFVGSPIEADWEAIQDGTWISHNVSFDMAVWARLCELELIPELPPEDWHCTADMCAYLQAPRALDAACEHLLNIQVDKTVRKEMEKVKYHLLPPKEKDKWHEYARLDSVNCLDLWKNYEEYWPNWEKQASADTRFAAFNGVNINLDMLEKGLIHLENVLFDAKRLIPWVVEGQKPTSTKAVKAECARLNIPPPKSMAKDSEVFDEWLYKYEEVAPWAKVLGTFRQANMLLEKLKEIEKRVDVNGVMPFSLKYFGAQATGRWAGENKLNMQNLTKAPRFGISLRHIFIPRPGRKFVIVDLGQIEPRCLAWMAGNESFLQYVRSGSDCYEASARACGHYRDPRPLSEVDKKLRQFHKARVLGAGYGASGAKYKIIAKAMAGLDLSLLEAKNEISQFRRDNQEIVNFWNRLDVDFKIAARDNEDFVFSLCSGREINYFNPCYTDKGYSASTCLDNSRRARFWGSKLTENVTQAMARDVFTHGMVDICKKGIDLIWSVHDEVICEVDEADAEDGLREIIESLTKTPTWCKGLPLAAEGGIMDRYDK